MKKDWLIKWRNSKERLWFEKIILAEQESFEASKRELNERRVVADEETITARNQ
jgi:hypothetical protein